MKDLSLRRCNPVSFQQGPVRVVTRSAEKVVLLPAKRCVRPSLKAPVMLSAKPPVVLTPNRRLVQQTTKTRVVLKPAEPTKPVYDELLEKLDEHMKDMFNMWQRDVNSWMNTKTCAEYNRLLGAGKFDKAYKMRHSAFSRYLCRTRGEKCLMYKLIHLKGNAPLEQQGRFR